MSLIYNATFDSQTRILSLLDKAGNTISSCEVPSKSNELTLTATADNSSVKLTKSGTVDNTYEVNTGSGWTAYEFDTVVPLNTGESCKWRCTNHPTSFMDFSRYVKFVMTGSIEASGEVYSMLSSNLSDVTTLNGYDYAFVQLFEDCTALIKAPKLPATTLAGNCYNSMFNGCTGLRQSPALPATTLATSCYNSMFRDCNSLTSAPQLPATTLTPWCYNHMFWGCYELTQAPALPATALAENCYSQMFVRCSRIKEVRISATSTATDALKEWLNGVASTGDFYCDPNATIFPTGASGCPTGWTRRNIADYPQT